MKCPAFPAQKTKQVTVFAELGLCYWLGSVLLDAEIPNAKNFCVIFSLAFCVLPENAIKSLELFLWFDDRELPS